MKGKPIKLISIFILFLSTSLLAQETIKIEPPNWWVGFKNNQLQLLIYGDNIASKNVEISSEKIIVTEVSQVENPNYLFINLTIDEGLEPGIYDIIFTDDKSSLIVPYEFSQRKPNSSKRKGFDPSDVIYLIMPDRFANGDASNDSHPDMKEKADRSNPDGRHGGDLQGIINHLDYIEDLGVGAIWLNPFLENNNPSYSYHGYAVTDFYKTDPRIGTNNLYKQFVEDCHNRDIKVIIDLIFNHSSLFHWIIEDLPSNDWIHQFPEYTRSNFRASTICDPHASAYDKSKMLTGWFDWHMPDLNQRNEFLKTYLIQNSIWWIEYSGLDGIRLDTQPYSYKEMITEWSHRIFEEYPDFSILGEAWLQKEAITSYFQANSNNRDSYSSNLETVTDFPLHYALKQAFNEKDTWTEGLARLYYILAQDFVYETPEKNVIFIDNHDVTRYFTSVEANMDKFKMGMAVLLTTRGIPMIYYGTEILMTGEESDGHGFIREDFPGGWPSDEVSAFSDSGRSELQNEAHDYVRYLINWRNNTDVLHDGKLTHFVPENNIYVYFRHNMENCVMVILNNDNVEKTIDTKRFSECIAKYKSAVNIITGDVIDITEPLNVNPKSATIFELIK